MPPSPRSSDSPNTSRCDVFGARDVCLVGENPTCSFPALRESRVYAKSKVCGKIKSKKKTCGTWDMWGKETGGMVGRG